MGDDLPRILREAVANLDPSGRLSRRDVVALRIAVRKVPSSWRAPGHPAQLFGEWAGLPDDARTAIRRTIESHIASSMRWTPRGRLWPSVVRVILTAGKRLTAAQKAPRLSRLLHWVSSLLWARPARTADQLGRLRARTLWALLPRPKLAHLLIRLDVSPDWLSGDYAEGVAVDRRCRGYTQDAERSAASGYLLGLDLIPAPDGIWCIEANLGAALRANRDRFYEVDPVGAGLLDLTAELGLGRLVWFGANQTPLNPWLHGQLIEGAARRGLDLTVLEGVRVPRREHPPGVARPVRALSPPSPLPRDSLVAHLRGYRHGPSYVATQKDALIRALVTSFGETGEERVRVPEMSLDPGPVRPLDEPGLPNLVYKYPGEDKGEGVHYMRARDEEHARALGRELDRRTGETGALFQPFVCSRLLEGRRFYDVRSFVFVSPVAVRYLGGLRYESARALPDQLPDGIVEDRRPFTMSVYFGNDYAPLPLDEEPEVRAATLAVGEGLARILSRAFQDRDPHP